jgi:hypothetical protein
MPSDNELLEKIETLQNMLVSFSTGGIIDHEEYKNLRNELLANTTIGEMIPRFIKTCHDTHQFWEFIKRRFATYQDRRTFLWDSFIPLIDILETRIRSTTPSDPLISEGLEVISSTTIRDTWNTALSRRIDDPDGAITSARSLLETVCKHILDESGIEYEQNATLPDLYRLTSTSLNLAPSQYSEHIIKRTLGGIVSTIEGIGALRNILGDAHGRGTMSEAPELRHAELAVNLSGALCTFLIACWESSSTTD